MENIMKATSISKVYTGEWLSLYKITYEDGHGNTKVYEMVSKKGTLRNPVELQLNEIGTESIAVIMAVFNNDMTKLLLSKEFRMGVNQYIYSFPAGLKEKGETISSAASRELKEETGLEVIDIIDCLEPTFTCAPVTDDLTDFVMIRAKGEPRDSKDINEEIHSKWYTKAEVRELLQSNEVRFAGRTQAFCYMWAVMK